MEMPPQQKTNAPNIMREFIKMIGLFVGIEKDMSIQLPIHMSDTDDITTKHVITILASAEEMC